MGVKWIFDFGYDECFMMVEVGMGEDMWEMLEYGGKVWDGSRRDVYFGYG